MTLVVEDGTGLAHADTYNTLAEVTTYATAKGRTFSASPADLAEAAARRATTWLDGIYQARFSGARLNGRAQTLQWPRTEATDASGEEIGEDEIPREVKAAHCEATIRELATPGSLAPDYVASTQVVREKIGPMEVEYRAASGVGSVRPIVSVIDDIMAPLIGARTGTSLFGSSARS